MSNQKGTLRLFLWCIALVNIISQVWPYEAWNMNMNLEVEVSFQWFNHHMITYLQPTDKTYILGINMCFLTWIIIIIIIIIEGYVWTPCFKRRTRRGHPSNSSSKTRFAIHSFFIRNCMMPAHNNQKIYSYLWLSVIISSELERSMIFFISRFLTSKKKLFL